MAIKTLFASVPVFNLAKEHFTGHLAAKATPYVVIVGKVSGLLSLKC